MKYLITGINGFVGPHLAKILIREGHDVCGLIRGSNGNQYDLLEILDVASLDKIIFYFADLLDKISIDNLISENHFDGVFHLAAQSHPPTSYENPVLTFEINVMGTLYLIESIRNYSPDTRFMFCSSSEVYGDQCKDTGILDSLTPVLPANPYGVSKAAIDLFMQERMKGKFIKGFITRAFSHTGPRRGRNFSISSDAYQLAKMVNGVQDKILLVGNLKTKRAVLDVRDVARAYHMLMLTEESNGKIFNICDDKYYEMQYFTDLLIEASGLKEIEQKIYDKYYRPIDIEIQLGDSSLLKEITGWSKEIKIEDTMSDLLDYWIEKIKK